MGNKFKIYEKSYQGIGIDLRYKFPAVTLSKNIAHFNTRAIEKMGLESDSEIVYGQFDGGLYVCIIPRDSRMSGYTRQRLHNTTGMYFGLNSLLFREIGTTVREVSNPIFDNGIDWFKLEEINDK